MEILAETTLSGSHYAAITVASIIAIVMFLFTSGLVIVAINDMDGTAAVISIFTLMVAVLFTYLVYNEIKEGPTVQYTAKVTDWNEVYEQGYEVVRNEGKLVILTKESR